MQTVRRLGKGAYGSVFLLNNGHALKVMDKDEGDRPSAGPLREIIALQSIPRHPNLVELIDSWANSYVYVMMKMYAGDALRISREIPLSFEDLLFVFSSAFEGVSHMHACGYVHQDLKSSNVLVFGDRTVTYRCKFIISCNAIAASHCPVIFGSLLLSSCC
jgi:serine/threonine protein kinase